MVDLAYTIYKPCKEPALEPPLLMIHGLCGLQASWGQLPQEISDKSGRKVMTVDLRNHGDSPRTDDMNITLMADDIVKLLKDLAIFKIIVLGHSLGGKVALALTLSQPHIVERILVEDMAPCTHVELADFGHQIVNALLNVKLDHSWASVENARTVIKKQLPEDFPAILKNHYTAGIAYTEGRYHWTTNLECVRLHLEELFDFAPFENTFDGPALFLLGESGFATSEDDRHSIQKFFPKAQIVMFNCGHWVHIEQKEEYLETVLKFLE